MPTAITFPFVQAFLNSPVRRFRSLAVIQGPTVEPVTLAEAKVHVRVDHDAEDDLILGLIAAARQYAERRIDRHLIDTRLEMKLDNFPAEAEIRLPRPPFSPTAGRQAVEMEWIDTQLQVHPMTEVAPNLTPSGDRFLIDRRATPAIITPNIYGYWPVVGPIRSAVTIRWWAGYGDSPAAVPRGIRAAILMLVGHWFLNREAASPTTLSEPPMGVSELLSMHRWGAYS